MFLVKIEKRAEKSALKMPSHYRKRIAELIDYLSNDAVPSELYDIRKLEGWEDSYRVRIGGIRISYRVFWDRKEIEVVEIEWRGGAYK